MTDLDLWPIGNCQVSALVDRRGNFVWGCVPRVDGDALFSALLGGEQPDHGYWAIELEDCVSVEQEYLRNTPVLVSRHTDAQGNAIEVTDFCPRFRRSGRSYRPVAFARIVRPLHGSPRIKVRLRPSYRWGQPCTSRAGGSNHLRFTLTDMAMRLSTTAPLGMVAEERSFR
ncbi:trehalase-like domain-containing protein, partial [Falsiroseomonas sp.]|uniref:trehalase-like domain-containing protein n=1 Tax=Falsiroseomonas sp. TaxID=2870721 RepID=UPI0027214550